MQKKIDQRWLPYLQRYSGGESRSPIFRDLILDDIKKLQQDRDQLSLLDIGCGGGFDGNAELQQSIAQAARQYVGIEPDKAIELGEFFTNTHRCFFGDAPIEQDSVDMAFAVMVIEHFERPQEFWNKVQNVLKAGGVFWGFTVDARHWFVVASVLAEKLKIKDWYLNAIHGKRGEERYENYSVYYRSNTPKQIQRLTTSFSSTAILNFHRVGQMDFYFPAKLRWLGRTIDRLAIGLGLPGSIMAVRVEK